MYLFIYVYKRCVMKTKSSITKNRNLISLQMICNGGVIQFTFESILWELIHWPLHSGCERPHSIFFHLAIVCQQQLKNLLFRTKHICISSVILQFLKDTMKKLRVK